VIVAFSTSSPLASVAIFSADGNLVADGEEMAPRAASGACLELLRRLLSELKLTMSDAELFVSDLGPGSFTGVKVGVTLAKTLAYSSGVLAAGVSSFDLIDAGVTVVVPSKRGEWFVREPGSDPTRNTELPACHFLGYGTGIEPATYPRAKNVVRLLGAITKVQPEFLVPEYLIEPSISQPKTPSRQSGD